MGPLDNQYHEAFARLVAHGSSSRQAYTDAYGKGKTVNATDAKASNLLRNPKVKSRIAELKAEIAAGIVRVEIAERSSRLLWLDEMARGLRDVKKARAEQYKDKPGGSTGLLVATVRMVGTGVNAKPVVEYEVDTGSLRELREYMKQAAQECGQWTEKRELTGRDGAPLTILDIDRIIVESKNGGGE